MIYQLFFKDDQRGQLLETAPYQPLGLEPEVNPGISANCPELQDARARLLLREYAAMLWCWRNQETAFSDHQWIGFTSHRQFDKSVNKSRTFFAAEDIPDIAVLAKRFDILGFGYYRLGGLSLAQHSEHMDPGFDAYIRRIFPNIAQAVPDWYIETHSCLYCNYWIMRRERFVEYMEWSWPIVQLLLVWEKTDPNLQGPRGPLNLWFLGDIMERLVILWGFNKKVADISLAFGIKQ